MKPITARQQQALDMVAACGGVRAAARAMGVANGTINGLLEKARRAGGVAQNQALAGWAAANPDLVSTPPSNAVSEGQQLKGLSTRVDDTGATDQQWIKTQRDSGEVYEMLPGQRIKKTATMVDAEDRVRVRWFSTDRDAEKEALIQRAALDAMKQELTPLPPVPAPFNWDGDLATLYTMTDCHVGMLAWDRESGEDWDLVIAENCLTDTLLQMIAAAPMSAIGILNQLGDFLHFDSLVPMTPTSKHILDADSRYQKVVQVAVRILRRVIHAMLTKHKLVHVEMKEGNHDPTGSVWLRVMFAGLYSDDPRVVVNMSPNPYSIFEHGSTLLGFYHGHLAKKVGLPLLFAAKFAEAWGRTKHRYIHTGHLHNVEEKEYPGIKQIQHPTLAAADAYAARNGWLSVRQATSMTYHIDRGEIARGIFIPN